MNSLQGMNMGLGAKKPTHRGRKPSGKPGAQHLSTLTAAHGAGDHQVAKVAALNYAKAMTQHLSGLGAMQTGGTETDPAAVGQTQVAPAAPPIQSAPKPAGPSMAMLAMKKRPK